MSELTVTSPIEQPISNHWLSQLTVADGLYLLVIMVAALIRLVNLDQIPLSPNEADSALAVWQLWQPEPVTAVASSALYLTLTALLTQLFGFSDTVMRLVPALAGIGIICLPWFIRHQLGLGGALTTTLLLTISPLHTVLSRSATGHSLALFCLLLLFVAWQQFQATTQTKWRNTAVVALSLGLATTPLFYSGLLAFVLTWWWHRSTTSPTPKEIALLAEETPPSVAPKAAPFPSADTSLLLDEEALSNANTFSEASVVASTETPTSQFDTPLSDEVPKPFTATVTVPSQTTVTLANTAETPLADAAATSHDRDTMLNKRVVILGVAVFMAASTLFFWVPSGLGIAAQTLGQWLTTFRINGVGFLNPFLALIRYELPLLLPGLIAFVWALTQNWALSEKRKRVVSFTLFWYITILLMLLLRHNDIILASLLIIPAYLLIGALVTHLATFHTPNFTAWALAGGVACFGALLIANLVRFNRVIILNPQNFTYLWIAITAFVFAVVTIFFVASWNVDAAAQGGLFGVLILLLFYQWGNSWWLGHHAANDPRERWVTTAVTDDDLLVMLDTLEEIALQTANATDDLDILSTVDTPVLRWYLRAYKNLQIASTIPEGATQHVIITAQQAELALTSDYVGADFGLLRTDAQPQPTTQPFLDTLRWWLFHESNAVIQQETIILWLRSDILEGL